MRPFLFRVTKTMHTVHVKFVNGTTAEYRCHRISCYCQLDEFGSVPTLILYTDDAVEHLELSEIRDWWTNFGTRRYPYGND
jgi:hypothetical protein